MASPTFYLRKAEPPHLVSVLDGTLDYQSSATTTHAWESEWFRLRAMRAFLQRHLVGLPALLAVAGLGLGNPAHFCRNHTVAFNGHDGTDLLASLAVPDGFVSLLLDRLGESRNERLADIAAGFAVFLQVRLVGPANPNHDLALRLVQILDGFYRVLGGKLLLLVGLEEAGDFG